MTDDRHRAPLSHNSSPLSEGGAALGPHPSLLAVLDWYFHQSFSRFEGPGALPFYCDPSCVGAFALAPEDLAAGHDSALFRLFVLLSMYQALRDVVIMRQQREFSGPSLQVIANPEFIEHAIVGHPCSALLSAEEFEGTCDVAKHGKVVDCGRCPVDAFQQVFQRVTRDSVEHGVQHGGGRQCGYTVASSPDNEVVLIADAQIPAHEVKITKKIEECPDFLTTARGMIKDIALDSYFLGLIPHQDGTVFKMRFMTIVTKTDWVLKKLAAHAKEKTRKSAKKSKRGRGPAPVSAFENGQASASNAPNTLTPPYEPATPTGYFDEEN